MEKKRAEFYAKHEYYAAITKTYDDLQGRPEDIAKVDAALPQDPGLGKLVYFLQETAQANGLLIKDLSLARSSANNNSIGAANSIKDINFSIDVLGSYSSLEGYLVALEKSSRIFEVTSISFGSPQVGQTYGFSLQIKTQSY